MKLPRFRSFIANTACATLLGFGLCGWNGVAVAAQDALVSAAPKLGFAGNLPEDTEFYFGSVNFKGHMDALKASAFWKEISALLDDKTPAPAAGDTTWAAAEKLLGDDWFFAGSAGTGDFFAWSKEFLHFYNEMNYRTLMTGMGMGGLGNAAPNVGPQFLMTLLQDPKQLERAQKIVNGFELPPFMIGFKAAKPADLAKQLIPEEGLKKIPAEKATVGTLTTPDGTVLRTITTEGSRLLTASEKKDILSKLPEELDANAKQAIEKVLTAFQAKKFAVGWGVRGDYLVFACGKNLDHVKFAASPAASLLAKPDLGYLTPYLSKNLFSIGYASAKVQNGVQDDLPVTPLLRGLVSGMKQSDMFRDLATALDKQLEELARREVAVFHRDYAPMTSVYWWDKGIHGESFGGSQARVYQTGKPLKYARVIDKPGVLVGWDYVRNKDYEKAQRAWSEYLVSALYSSAQELVKVGLGGPQVSQQFAMFDQLGVPLLLKIYHADVDIADKGLDGETAGVIDINGKMPALPGVPPETKGMKFPRLTSISQVANRAQIAASWKVINDTINQAAGVFMGGGQPNNPAGPAAIPMPEPISSDKNGVTIYFYALPFLSGDLLPCAAINDQVLMISSSKDAVENFAAELSKPPLNSQDGLVWHADPAALVEYLVQLSKFAPDQKPGADKEIRQILKWTKPFHAMEGRMFQEGSTPRMSFTWEISDLVSFD